MGAIKNPGYPSTYMTWVTSSMASMTWVYHPCSLFIRDRNVSYGHKCFSTVSEYSWPKWHLWSQININTLYGHWCSLMFMYGQVWSLVWGDRVGYSWYFLIGNYSTFAHDCIDIASFRHIWPRMTTSLPSIHSALVSTQSSSMATNVDSLSRMISLCYYHIL